MHADEDFQRDAGGGQLQGAVDAIRANPASYEKCAIRRRFLHVGSEPILGSC